MTYARRELFGGAITCDLPAAWRNLGDSLPVPDNQEVYQGMTDDPNLPAGPCLVVEVMEYQQECSNQEAAGYFYADLAQVNGISDPADMTFTPRDMPVAASLPDNVTVCSGVGMQRISHGRDADVFGNPMPPNPRWVTIEICALRMPHVGSDLLLTLSRPGAPGPDGSVGFSDVFLHAVQTFQVHNWGLFG